MSAYEAYEYATKRMNEINECIAFHRGEVAKLEEQYLDYEADATIAYNTMQKEGDIYQSFYEKTNAE